MRADSTWFVEQPNPSPDCVKSRSIHQMIGFSPHRTGQFLREIGTAQAERPRNRVFSPPLIFRRTFYTVSRWSGPGIQRQKQEMLGMQALDIGCAGAVPGRSARSRYADPIAWYG